MSKKTFNFVSALIGAAQAAAVAVVAYTCEPATAATIGSVIAAVATLAINVCSKFVKEDNNSHS